MKIYTPIEIEIEDVAYKIRVRDANEAERKRIQDAMSSFSDVTALLGKKATELKRLERQLSENQTVLNDLNVIQKTKIWLENRDLREKIETLKAEVEALAESADAQSGQLEEAMRIGFDVRIEDSAAKEALRTEMGRYGISYGQILPEINSVIVETKAKK